MELLEQISASLQAGDDTRVAELTQQAIDASIAADDILANGLIAGMDVVGDHFRAHEIGDIHDIGKNLVGIMLEGAGFEVIDLGKDVAPEAFVDAAVEAEVQVIGMSTLLTTTVPAMLRVVEILEERGLNGSIRTIAGGAPVTPELVHEIGADAYGYDAANAVEIVKELTGAASP